MVAAGGTDSNIYVVSRTGLIPAEKMHSCMACSLSDGIHPIQQKHDLLPERDIQALTAYTHTYTYDMHTYAHADSEGYIHTVHIHISAITRGAFTS